MLDLTTATGAIGAIKGVRDTVSAMLNMRVSSELQSKLIELQAAVLDAQSKMLDMQAAAQQEHVRVAELEQELATLRERSAIIAQMQRRAPFYRLPADPDPYCPRCVEVEARAIHAVKIARLGGGLGIWECPACKWRVAA